MTETYVTYGTGSWTLLARAGTHLLVEAATTDEALSRLWAVADELELPELLATVRDLLPGRRFCALSVVADQVLLAQDGVVATLDGRPVDAGPDPVPLDVPAGGAMVVASVDAGALAPQIPLESGVVAAGSLVVVQVGSVASTLPPPPVTEPVVAAAPEPDPVAVSSELWDDVPAFVETALPAPAADQPRVLTLETAPPPVPRVPEQPVGVRGETVLAGICLQGHLSGAYAPRCRVCGDEMPQQTPREIERPSLGVLELESGERVQLDRGAVLGRAPRVPQDAVEEPSLVNLAAYGRDISRQHAEVVLQGWNVFVRDLGSANGTWVRDPSGQVTELEVGRSVPLVPGSVIDIAEVTTVTYRTT